MRHAKLRTKLNRTKSHRRATVKNIIRGLLKHERVVTTVKKAKVTSMWADKLITLAKKNNLHAIRQVESFLQDKSLISKLFKEIGPRFEKRQGGYTRVLKYQRRRGDGTEMAILELTEKEIMPFDEGTKTKKAKKESSEEQKVESAEKETDTSVIVDKKENHKLVEAEETKELKSDDAQLTESEEDDKKS